MSDTNMDDDRREYFRIKDRLAIEIRAISDDDFLQLENTIRYNPTQVIDKAYDMHFLKESISSDEKEKNHILSYLVMIDKKPRRRADAMYNIGNTAFKGGQLDPAIKAYTAALVLNPGDKQAKQNLEFCLKKKQEQQNQPDSSQQKQQQNQPTPEPRASGDKQQPQAQPDRPGQAYQ